MPKAAGTEQAVMRGAPWRLAMRVFTDKMPPLQQALFNISATEKAATPVIPPADDNAFNGSLSDETAVMAWLKKADCGSAKAERSGVNASKAGSVATRHGLAALP